MHAQRLLPLLCVAVIFTSLDAAAQVTLEGTVRDETSSDPVEGARIAVLRAADYDTLASGVLTDADGRFEVSLEIGTAVESEVTASKDRYRVGSAHPNPTAAGTVYIPYEAPHEVASDPIVEVHDILGRHIRPGSHLARGVYFYRLRFGSDHLSTSRALVVAEPAVLRFQPTRSLSPKVASNAAGSMSAGAAKQGAANDRRVLIQVRRGSFKSVEVVHDLPPEGAEQVDFQLSPVGPLTPRIQVSGLLEAGSAVVFDATASDGDIRTYAWDFGDGKRGTGPRVAHLFTAEGPYEATLVVTDYENSRASISMDVSITGSTASSETATLYGFVAGEDRDPIAGVRASIEGSAVTAESDAAGMLILENMPTNVPLTVRLSKTGYATGFVRVHLPLAAEAGQFETFLLKVGSTDVVSNIGAGGVFRGNGGASLILTPGSLVDSQGSPVTGGAEVSMTPINVSDAVELGAFPGSFAGLEADGTSARLATFGVADYSVTGSDGEGLQLDLGEHAVIELPLYTELDQTGRPLEIGETIPVWSLDEETGTWIEETVGRVIASDATPTGLALRAEVTHFSWWNVDVSVDTERIGLNFIPAVGAAPISLPPETSVSVRASVSTGGPRSDAVDTFPLGGLGGVLIPLDMGPIRITAAVDPNPGDVPPDEILVGELTIDPDASPITGGDAFDVVLEPRVRSMARGCESLVAGRTIRRGVEVVGDLDCFMFEGEEGDFALLAFRDVQVLRAFVGNIWLSTPGGEPIWQAQFGASGAARRIRLPETGTYRLLVSGQGVSRGSYLLEYNLEGDCGQGETLDRPASVLCSIETNGDVDTFVFDASAGQGAVIEACSIDFGGDVVEGKVELSISGGSPIASTSFTSNCGRMITPLPSAGRYEVRVTGVAGSGPYKITLETPASVSLDSDVAGNVAVPFTSEKWVFTIPVSTEVIIGTVNESVGNFLDVRLFDEAGSLLGLATALGNFTTEIRRVLPAGTYVVEQDPRENRTGAYRMVVRTVGAFANAPLNTFVDVDIDEAFGVSRHRFSLATPETVVIGLKNISVGNFLDMMLYDASGQIIANATATALAVTQIESSLPAGTYDVELNPRADLTGEMSFVVRLIEPALSTDVDVLTPGSVTEEFQYDIFAVNVTEAGAYVLGTINESVGNFLDTRLIDVDGDQLGVVTASDGSTSELDVVLSGGTYFVEQDPRRDMTGDYAFVLRRIAEPQEIAPDGTEINGQVTDIFDYDRYSFTLPDARTVEVVTTNIDVGNFLITELYEADGTRVGQATASANNTSTLTATLEAGTYTLIQNPRGSLTGGYSFTVTLP